MSAHLLRVYIMVISDSKTDKKSVIIADAIPKFRTSVLLDWTSMLLFCDIVYDTIFYPENVLHYVPEDNFLYKNHTIKQE